MNLINFIRKGCLALFLSPFVFFLLVNIVPYIYTPPALTNQKLEIYSDVVDFLETHPEVTSMRITHFGFIDINGDRGLYLYGDYGSVEIRKYLSESDITHVKKLSKGLDTVHCQYAQSENGVIVFYPDKNDVMPPPAGVLYSIDGSDPNNMNNTLTANNKPFVKISGNWYASRKIVLRVLPIKSPVPKSLIDLTRKQPSNLATSEP